MSYEKHTRQDGQRELLVVSMINIKQANGES